MTPQLRKGTATNQNTGKDQHQTDISEILQDRSASVSLLRVNTDIMEAAGINETDVVAVDRNAQPVNNNIVVAMIDNELVIRKLESAGGKQFLVTPARRLAPLDVTGRLQVWGVVLYVIRKVP